MEAFITLEQAAQHVGVTPRTLRKWLKEGLKHVRVSSRLIRTKMEWVEDYMAAHLHSRNHIEELVNSVLGDLAS